jgi:hypothetical protein
MGRDWMLNIMGDIPSHFLRLINVTFNGQTNAFWIRWEIGNLIIQASQFKNPNPARRYTTSPLDFTAVVGRAAKPMQAGGLTTAGFPRTMRRLPPQAG